MRPRNLLLLILVLTHPFLALANGIIKGKISGTDGPISYANIGLPGIGMGTFSDETGAFVLSGVPPGKHKLLISSVGFHDFERYLDVTEGGEISLKINLEQLTKELAEIVISGNGQSIERSENPRMVGIISRKALETVQANSLADGLSFQTGLRMETNCQTCGYSQLRMNGMNGAYSQILINGKPIFNSLMGLYGLEQIPASMIEQIEITKGGSTTAFGASAIAGTVNVITKEPTEDFMNIGLFGGIINGQSMEGGINAVFTKTFEKAGFTLAANKYRRDSYDANNDGFSELPLLDGINLKLNSNFKTGKYSTLGIDLHTMSEYRRGGNKIDLAPHLADQAEERDYDIILGSIDFKSSIPDLKSVMSVYLTGQHTNRKHYTGVDQADAYGNTVSSTLLGGFKYSYVTTAHNISIGTEYMLDEVYDEIKLYNYLVDQQTRQLGLYLQDDWKISGKISLLSGLRMDTHNFLSSPVYSPNFSLLIRPFNFSQIRGGYTRGFRAPQAFDTDMHVAFAGGGVSLIQLNPGLEKETSESYTLSWNFDKPSETYIVGFTADAFYTNLFNSFVLEEYGADSLGNMILQKNNGPGSTVYGISLEGRINYNNYVEATAGVTRQRSSYESPVQWSAELEPTTYYLRTPDVYGFYLLDITPVARFGMSLSGVFTGSMKVPHFAGAPGVDRDALIESQTFFEQGIRLFYDLPLKSSGLTLQFYGGVKNIFNSYQDDFDTGTYRDSNFVYGPARPRSFFFGLTLQTQQRN